MSLIKRFWEGKITLWKSYWLGAIIFGNIFLAVIGASFIILGMPKLLYLIQIAFLYFVIGVWRSANNYTGPMIWSILARIFVIMGLFLSTGEMLKITNPGFLPGF